MHPSAEVPAAELVRLLDHEVRSPLTLAYGWAELLLDEAHAHGTVALEVAFPLQRAIAEMTETVVGLLTESTRRLEAGESLTSAEVVSWLREMRSQR